MGCASVLRCCFRWFCPRRGGGVGKALALASIAAVGAITGVARAQTNLVVNGSFEEPHLTGPFAQWTSSNPIPGWQVDALGQGVATVGYFGNPLAIAGDQSVELNYFMAGGISQSIPTVRGGRYIISFLMAGQYYVGPDTKEIQVEFDGVPLGVASWSFSGTNGQWVRKTFVGTATGPSAVIHFVGITPANVDGGPYIDDVVISCLASSTPSATVIGCSGTPTSLTASAEGTGPLSYRWQRDGVDIDALANPSAATATLVIGETEPGDAGAYVCIISSRCGSVSTGTLTLVVPNRCSAADLPIGGSCADGVVDGSDFVAFINSFAIGDVNVDPIADVAGGNNGTVPDPDGTIDGGDFVAFINAFALGC